MIASAEGLDQVISVGRLRFLTIRSTTHSESEKAKMSLVLQSMPYLKKNAKRFEVD